VKENLSGKLLECMKHYREIDDDFSGRKMMAEFIGCSYEGSVLYWFSRLKQPTSKNFNGLAFFLEMLGYKVKEIQGLASEAHDLAKAIAFRVVSVEESAEALGVTPNTILRIISGRNQAMSKTKDRINRYLADKAIKVTAQESAWWSKTSRVSKPHLNGSEVEQPVERRQDVSKVESLSSEERTVLEKDHVLEAFASLLAAAMPLADLIVTDMFTDEDRDRLRRELCKDRNLIFHLKNRLARLCSKTAHRELADRQ